MSTVGAKTIAMNHRLLWLAMMALLLVFTVKTLVLPPAGKQPNVVIWLFHVVPLLCCLPGMWRRSHRGYVAVCFVILLYFVMAGTSLFSPLLSVYDTLTLVLTVVIYISALLAARWQRTAPVAQGD